MGSSSRLGALVIASATNITSQAISAASLNFNWSKGRSLSMALSIQTELWEFHLQALASLITVRLQRQALIPVMVPIRL